MKRFKFFLEDFSIQRSIWQKLLVDEKKRRKIFFDLENDDPIDKPLDLKIEDGDKHKDFTIQLCSSGGDWENPVLYFRCQEKRSRDGMGLFIFIPNDKEGNASLWKDDKGNLRASDDDQHRNENKNDKELAQESVKKFLKTKLAA